mmetsp:Transcript_22496/g.32851  ORF Transcript_22496/g.32851 Transcript_22496/m.32851 type:complete len:723 (+) Transcript_22496:106-2274(+)|eukprot:CAMPEP_0185030028 /NCGR_PEP_ID=MMETSP1103-20130426/16749_1 /TAXON_ID=36769 /ORGANISM="Paraphysomonas bandaiensis, Strain Caron Lab Isolate" /LENGTH=722 /DNA_ID=CAMNT_0027564991 /DNA_START=23 /DNA_END=2191 /DNA_ORIENTATION=-
MIIGVALVVDDIRKGQRLVFRYPEAVPSSVINYGENFLKFHKDYLALSPDNFARLFRPNHSMFNKVLDLVIDDLQYVSLPIPCQRDPQLLSGDDPDITDDITMFSVIISTVREGAIAKAQSKPRPTGRRQPGEDPVAELLGLGNGRNPLSIAVLHRVVESFARALHHQEKRAGYVSKEVSLIFKINEDVRSSFSNHPTTEASNPAAVVSAPLNSSTGAADSVQEVDKHSTPAPAIKSNSTGSLSSPSPTQQAPMLVERTLVSQEEAQINRDVARCECVLQQSSLANELRALYHSLVGGYCVSMTVNGVVSINIPLLSPLTAPSPTSPLKEISEVSRRIDSLAASSEPVIRSQSAPAVSSRRSSGTALEPISFHSRGSGPMPFQTFLPIADPEALGAVMQTLGCSIVNPVGGHIQTNSPRNAAPADSDLPAASDAAPAPGKGSLRSRAAAARCLPGQGVRATATTKPALRTPSHHCSPKMWRLLLAMNPTQSFAEIRHAVDTPLAEVYSAVNHLCEWGLGEIIGTITAHSLYQVHPDAPLQCETTSDPARRSAGGRVAHSFASCFGGGDINSVLSAFTGKVPLHDAITRFPRHLQAHGVDIVVWLLRWHMIRELHYFFVDVSLLMSVRNSRGQLHMSLNDTGSVPRQSGNFGSAFQKRGHTREHSYDMMIQTDRDMRVIRKKLSPYLDGKTPLCDILWLEDLKEDEVFSAVRHFNIVVNIRPL